MYVEKLQAVWVLLMLCFTTTCLFGIERTIMARNEDDFVRALTGVGVSAFGILCSWAGASSLM